LTYNILLLGSTVRSLRWMLCTGSHRPTWPVPRSSGAPDPQIPGV